MRRLTSLAAGSTAVAAALAITGVSAAGTAQADTGSPVVGHAYVNGNTAGTNTVDVLDRHADGSLTPGAGSPVAIGGAGLGAGLGSQGAIEASPDGRYLLTVDAGSSEISVLRVGADGTPSLVGAPVPSGGVEPVSITISPQRIVYVANVGNGGSNYAGFRLTPVGKLIPIPGSVVAVPEGSAVGDVLFNSTGDRLVGTRDTTSLIDSFTVGANGRLTAAAGSPFPAQSLGPIGSEFRPTDPSQLFVSNAHAGPGQGSVSAFQDGPDGVLTSIGDSPFADNQTAACWVEITHDGKYLFTVNTASASLSRYAINVDGSLTLLGSTAFNNGAGAVDARLSPDGSTLSVTGGSSHLLSTFAVDGGNLTELSSSPVALPAGGAPTGLVVL
jgi:6-phosphogluconolactonase